MLQGPVPVRLGVWNAGRPPLHLASLTPARAGSRGSGAGGVVVDVDDVVVDDVVDVVVAALLCRAHAW